MCEVFLLLSGTVNYKVEGEYYHLTPMDAILIVPHKLHWIEVDGEQGYERMVLHFSPDLLPSFADLSFLAENNPLLPTSFVIPKALAEQSDLAALMQRFKQLGKNPSKYTDLRFVSAILQVVETLNDLVMALGETDETAPTNVDRLSYKCIQYVKAHLTDGTDLSPQTIAAALHVSASHLRQSFKREIGVTLHTYIANQKMQFAKRMLAQGVSPQAVSDMLGFEYYSTFYQNFVKRFGVNPNAYAQL